MKGDRVQGVYRVQAFADLAGVTFSDPRVWDFIKKAGAARQA